MSVKVNNLTKIFNEQKAVNAISFEVNKGEILGFLGPNGAGKSTTMKMLTSYIVPTNGSATICGHDVVSDALESRKKIGYLSEGNPLYYNMYVKEFLAFSAQLNGIKDNIDQKIKMQIDVVGLGKEQHKKIGELSKGYKQRVGLAQALIHNPEVLILDEPTSGLDPNQLVDIRNLIKDLGKEKTIIFSTHIMQEVQAVCDRIIIINNGTIVANDAKSNILNQLNGEVSIKASFVDKININTLKQIASVSSVETISNNSYILKGNDSLHIRKALFALAVAQNNVLIELKEEQQSLEHTFQMLTKN
ncbi:MAG: ATP-binding cassette domain-containing protein [Chitinophagales bacterium]|nr:ATP-binding cassette domain-containing protein [Chitinophagales bacterium]